MLAVLAIAAIPIYLATRKAAELNRRRESHVADYWYRQGRKELNAGNAEQAIGALRQAVTNNRNDRSYGFALAQALAAAGEDDEARLALTRLRETAPEDPTINLELARLAARRHAFEEAIRYYHHTLYGVWTGPQIDERRRAVRLELLHFLLARKQRSRALAELVILANDTPRTAKDQLELGELFVSAGDARSALAHIVLATELAPRDVTALTTAGEVAFQLGDYRLAERYLVRATRQKSNDGRAASLLATTRLIDSSDPLAPHLSRNTRVERTRSALQQVRLRLQQCGPKMNSALAEALRVEIDSIQPTITTQNVREDPELIATGADLAFRVEALTLESCGAPAGLDQALLLAGRKHNAGEL
jgi:Flp pilus assembly protein TadD